MPHFRCTLEGLTVDIELSVISVRVNRNTVALSDACNIGAVEKKQDRTKNVTLWDSAQDVRSQRLSTGKANGLRTVRDEINIV